MWGGCVCVCVRGGGWRCGWCVGLWRGHTMGSGQGVYLLAVPLRTVPLLTVPLPEVAHSRSWSHPSEWTGPGGDCAGFLTPTTRYHLPPPPPFLLNDPPHLAGAILNESATTSDVAFSQIDWLTHLAGRVPDPFRGAGTFVHRFKHTVRVGSADVIPQRCAWRADLGLRRT